VWGARVYSLCAGRQENGGDIENYNARSVEKTERPKYFKGGVAGGGRRAPRFRKSTRVCVEGERKEKYEDMILTQLRYGMEKAMLRTREKSEKNIRTH